MTESAENRIEFAFENMLNEVDKHYLRQLQAEMHKCAAKCCENPDSSVESVHACVQLCGQHLKKAQALVQSEFHHLHKRLQGCALTCNAETKRKLEAEPIDKQISMYSSEFHSCVERCIDSNIALIPLIMQKMKEILDTRGSDQEK